MRTGLVMEGGSMRGMFTAGVIDVFMENGISFDGAIGVSAGATFGCNIKSGQIGRSVRYCKRFINDYRFGSFKSFIKTGDFFDVKFCYHDIPDRLDVFDTNTFKSNPMEFYVVASDIEGGRPVYHKCFDGRDKDLTWIQASASIPLISNIVNVDGMKLLDGGITDSVPLKYFESIGYDRNVVILTRSDEYSKKKNKLSPVCKMVYRKYPRFVEAFTNRHIMYNSTVDYIREKEKRGEIFVIRPSVELDIKSAEKDVNKIQKAYEMGRKEGIKAIEMRKVKKWLEDKDND